ncbi:MAG TPA: class I SAM-dependent methyltransferase [Pyrinomonadaceae bacterium]|nr:class I SAM-dependent methyltransferase [Pyrinomonadaceae bacterium]
MKEQASVTRVERSRIEAEYERRRNEIDSELYSPWHPAEVFFRCERKRVAARMLHAAGRFPRSEDQCLEIGCGAGGWFSDLLSWGPRQNGLHGIEISSERTDRARELFPAADVRLGDAAEMPWNDGIFNLVVASTVFTSILDNSIRRLIANEITRVLAPRGALLWYDFAINNPRNPNVRGINRKELRSLFPELHGKIRSITLAPPLARIIAPRSWPLATLLEAIPLLRTHMLAVLVKS